MGRIRWKLQGSCATVRRWKWFQLIVYLSLLLLCVQKDPYFRFSGCIPPPGLCWSSLRLMTWSQDKVERCKFHRLAGHQGKAFWRHHSHHSSDHSSIDGLRLFLLHKAQELTLPSPEKNYNKSHKFCGHWYFLSIENNSQILVLLNSPELYHLGKSKVSDEASSALASTFLLSSRWIPWTPTSQIPSQPSLQTSEAGVLYVRS